MMPLIIRCVAGTWSRFSTNEYTLESWARPLESELSEGVEVVEACSHDFSFCRVTSTVSTRRLNRVGRMMERSGKKHVGDDEKTFIEIEYNFITIAVEGIYKVLKT
ncbi:hypothetical protein ZOSMA_330G00240 [Zostera marina]|uniref:Uncharacterized protein n=1 Tax=Zostera marina TaxID=29655 RepID=A0A0K9P853_ZOSMR|nr:hypothetical protein ZOSMA_330G00240 [Zostera marina]